MQGLQAVFLFVIYNSDRDVYTGRNSLAGASDIVFWKGIFKQRLETNRG